MRIVFVADVHHAFRQVGELLEQTQADLYFITGDLVSRAFFRYETAWRFMELEQVLGGWREPGETLDRTARRLIGIEGNEVLPPLAREYRSLSQKAEIYLRKAYNRLEDILNRYPDKNVFVLPGNYDMDLRRTALAHRNLHLKTFQIEDLRIAGYGGADVRTPGLPDHLQAPYHEGHSPDGSKSEAFTFFDQVRPNVLLLHQPAYGYLDELAGYGNIGAVGVRAYLDQADIALVLSGHLHERWGAILKNRAACLNPSNFGTTIEVSQTRPGGFFFDILIEDRIVKQAVLCRIHQKRVTRILDYRPIDRALEPVILDEKTYALLGGDAPKVRHIEPIRNFQRVKSFFLGYETRETRALITELEAIQESILEQGMEVAFDLLGSLSFGMAQEGSDMDLVVYMRSKDCVLDEEDTCGIPRPMAAVMRELEERHLEIEVCDSMDLDRIKQAIEGEDLEDGQLQRFVFYRLVCRPINLHLIKSVENLLLDHEELRLELEQGIEEHLNILVSSTRHIKSFDKYKARLRDQGVDLSPEVEEALRNYLRGSR